MKHLKRADKEAFRRAGNDLLRSLAGHPQRSVHLGRDQITHRILVIHRDEFGRISTTEQIEEIDRTSLNADFLE